MMERRDGMADEQKMQLTPDEQAKHAERRAALLKLTQANIASINRVREAALNPDVSGRLRKVTRTYRRCL